MSADLSCPLDCQCVHTRLTGEVLGKHQAMEQPLTLAKSDINAHRSDVEAMYALSEAVNSISGEFASGSTCYLHKPHWSVCQSHSAC